MNHEDISIGQRVRIVGRDDLEDGRQGTVAEPADSFSRWGVQLDKPMIGRGAARGRRPVWLHADYLEALEPSSEGGEKKQ